MSGRNFYMQRMFASDQSYYEDPARDQTTGYTTRHQKDPERIPDEPVVISLSEDSEQTLWKGALG